MQRHSLTFFMDINPLPDNKILDWSKLKAFVDDKIINVTQKLKFLFERVENMWLPAFSPFPTMFSKGFLYMYRVDKSRDCVPKSLNAFNPLPDWSKLKQIADDILKCVKNEK